jgi:hypothetical protein
MYLCNAQQFVPERTCERGKWRTPGGFVGVCIPGVADVAALVYYHTTQRHFPVNLEAPGEFEVSGAENILA